MTAPAKAKKLLEQELEKLKNLLDTGYELRVEWIPGGSEDREGEVKNGTIFIYTEDPSRVVDTLWDEFIDYVVCQAIKPYEKIVNMQRHIINNLLASIQEEAYREKEKVVEKLKRLLEA